MLNLPKANRKQTNYGRRDDGRIGYLQLRHGGGDEQIEARKSRNLVDDPQRIHVGALPDRGNAGRIGCSKRRPRKSAENVAMNNKAEAFAVPPSLYLNQMPPKSFYGSISTDSWVSTGASLVWCSKKSGLRCLMNPTTSPSASANLSKSSL